MVELENLRRLSARVGAGDPLVSLTPGDIGCLVNWDAEIYRQSLRLTW